MHETKNWNNVKKCEENQQNNSICRQQVTSSQIITTYKDGEPDTLHIVWKSACNVFKIPRWEELMLAKSLSVISSFSNLPNIDHGCSPTFLRCPWAVPRKTTVYTSVEVAATAVSLVGKVRMASPSTGCSPPSGVFTSIPQKSSFRSLILCGKNKCTSDEAAPQCSPKLA